MLIRLLLFTFICFLFIIIMILVSTFVFNSPLYDQMGAYHLIISIGDNSNTLKDLGPTIVAAILER